MPGAVFVPAALNDLSVSVSLTSEARGDLFYRAAARWQNLPAGTSGQFLRTNGAGADPSWATITPGSATLAGDTDVSFTSVARGDVIYRGATVWNNLPAGTSGFVLTANGAGADPSWQAAGGSVAAAVILAPAAANRNLVQPTANAVQGLTIKQFGSSTANWIEFQASGAAANVVYVDSSGNVILDKQSASDTIGLIRGRVVGSFNFWSLNPYDSGGATRMVFSNSIGGNIIDCTVGDLVYVALLTQAQIWRVGGTEIFRIDANGGVAAGGTITQLLGSAQVRFGMAGNAANDERQDSFRIKPVGAVAAFWRPFCFYKLSSDTIPTSFLDSNGDWQFQRLTSVQVRPAASIVTSLATSTDATRKARVVHNVYDTAAREGFRIEASGTAPMIGFLGAAAVGIQSVGAAATDAATTQTLCNNLRTALINFGLAQT